MEFILGVLQSGSLSYLNPSKRAFGNCRLVAELLGFNELSAYPLKDFNLLCLILGVVP